MSCLNQKRQPDKEIGLKKSTSSASKKSNSNSITDLDSPNKLKKKNKPSQNILQKLEQDEYESAECDAKFLLQNSKVLKQSLSSQEYTRLDKLQIVITQKNIEIDQLQNENKELKMIINSFKQKQCSNCSQLQLQINALKKSREYPKLIAMPIDQTQNNDFKSNQNEKIAQNDKKAPLSMIDAMNVKSKNELQKESQIKSDSEILLKTNEFDIFQILQDLNISDIPKRAHQISKIRISELFPNCDKIFLDNAESESLSQEILLKDIEDQFKPEEEKLMKKDEAIPLELVSQVLHELGENKKLSKIIEISISKFLKFITKAESYTIKYTKYFVHFVKRSAKQVNIETYPLLIKIKQLLQIVEVKEETFQDQYKKLKQILSDDVPKLKKIIDDLKEQLNQERVEKLEIKEKIKIKVKPKLIEWAQRLKSKEDEVITIYRLIDSMKKEHLQFIEQYQALKKQNQGLRSKNNDLRIQIECFVKKNNSSSLSSSKSNSSIDIEQEMKDIFTTE